jgi:hypothetical protein
MEWDEAAGRFRWTVESLVDVDELELGRRAAERLQWKGLVIELPARGGDAASEGRRCPDHHRDRADHHEPQGGDAAWQTPPPSSGT